ncbi:MAG TPA: DUF1345 domain-containing protein [Rickettsiales bacterium]|nr:DUF1345 domain-containing protein [Rickettsiales bacterium]
MIRHAKARPRLLTATAVGCILWFLLPENIHDATRILVAWDSGVGLYLALAMWMMWNSDTSKIRRRAAAQDEGRMVILFMTTFTAMASLAAIVAELSTAKSYTGIAKTEHVLLAGITVFLSWTFMHTMYALHYAHEFYTERNGKMLEGLEFPGHCHAPDYWDFIYYSYVIGTASATADINITSHILRRINTIHCMVAFFFNTTILALTVNIGAGLF